MTVELHKAYIIGIGLGDGNLSNPNKRAVRLRVTCDKKYPKLIQKIRKSISIILPKNRVSIVDRKDGCVDISCYSNQWEGILGWKAGEGSKAKQKIGIPEWIKQEKRYEIECLRGLIETDGSIYNDRKYKMVIFTSSVFRLANDVYSSIIKIGFNPRFYKIEKTGKNKNRTIYHVRLSRETEDFINLVKPEKT